MTKLEAMAAKYSAHIFDNEACYEDEMAQSRIDYKKGALAFAEAFKEWCVAESGNSEPVISGSVGMMVRFLSHLTTPQIEGEEP